MFKLFTKDGFLMCDLGVGHFDHPRDMCIDRQGNIMVVTSVKNEVVTFYRPNMNVFRFPIDIVDFPFSITCNHQKELFICDNKYHKIYVFTYQGEQLRVITNEHVQFPIELISISGGGLLVCDNPNNFNVTIFDRMGTLCVP